MRKVLNKVLAGIMSATLVASLAIGMSFTQEVKADETPVELPMWSFEQGGDYTLNGGQYEGGNGNMGLITSVTLPGETLSGWHGMGSQESINEAKTATQQANQFSINIKQTGWDCQWSAVTGLPENRINPWSIQAHLNKIPVIPGHIYKISFKAHSSTAKWAYVAFGTDMEGTPAPYGEGNVPEGDNAIIQITPAEKDFSYTFTNWVSADTINMDLMLGAFGADYDYDGTLISSYIDGYSQQSSWSGTVDVKDVQVMDLGLDPKFVEQPTPPPVPTDKPTVKPTDKPPVKPTVTPKTKKFAKVKKLRVKNNKKRTIKITWKKVAKAKKYTVKVGKKTYTAKKPKLTVKKLKKGKKYTVKVRAKAANGYKAGPWAKKKIKIKK